MENIFEKLRSHYGSHHRVAKAISVHPKTYYNWRAGRMPKWAAKMLVMLIRDIKVKRLMK